MAHVEPLQKISVAVQAGAAPGDLNLPLARPEVTFICGIGTGGMTWNQPLNRSTAAAA